MEAHKGPFTHHIQGFIFNMLLLIPIFNTSFSTTKWPQNEYTNSKILLCTENPILNAGFKDIESNLTLIWYGEFNQYAFRVKNLTYIMHFQLQMSKFNIKIVLIIKTVIHKIQQTIYIIMLELGVSIKNVFIV